MLPPLLSLPLTFCWARASQLSFWGGEIRNIDLQHIPNVIFTYIIMYIPKFVTVRHRRFLPLETATHTNFLGRGTLPPILINYKLGLLIFLRQSIYLHTKWKRWYTRHTENALLVPSNPAFTTLQLVKVSSQALCEKLNFPVEFPQRSQGSSSQRTKLSRTTDIRNLILHHISHTDLLPLYTYTESGFSEP